MRLAQGFACSGDGDRLLAPLEQRPLDDLFQALDLHGDRRLGAAQAGGGAGEAFLRGDGDEGAQQVDLQVALHGSKITKTDKGDQVNSFP